MLLLAVVAVTVVSHALADGKPEALKIPYNTELEKTLAEGHTIHASGIVNGSPKRINVTFYEGKPSPAGLVFQWSARFDNGSCNTVEYYTKDGKFKDHHLPFRIGSGEDFDFRLRYAQGKIMMYTNRHSGEGFNHVSQNKVNYVTISGDLAELKRVHYGGVVFKLPYSAKVPFVPGKRLDISGISLGGDITLNLYHENKDVALQISIRYSEHAIMRNAMINNAWGSEERDGKMPLKEHEVFDLRIVNKEFSFDIYVNDVKFATFNNRGSAKDIQAIRIEGNMALHSVSINDA